jgi:aspartate kinase
MHVYKFGGTSVGSVVNMSHVKAIINDSQEKVVVLSAMSGTTNALVAISKAIEEGDLETARTAIHRLNEAYNSTVYDLIQDPSLQQEVSSYVNGLFKQLIEATTRRYSRRLHDSILANGELLSTFMFSRYLQQEGLNAVLLPALDFMRIDVKSGA